MKRNVLLALVAALALGLGFSSTAIAATADGAHASAKKGKAKGCKKGKGKAKGCKGKGAVSGLPLTSGTYESKTGAGLEVKGKTVSLTFEPKGSSGPTCIPIPVMMAALSTKSTANSFKASGSSSNPLFTIKWSITVQSNLSYKLTIDSSLSGEDVTPCNKPGVVINGKLVKDED